MRIGTHVMRRAAAGLCLALSALPAAGRPLRPANPHASPEAAALLRFMSGLTGRTTLTGQHNFPNRRDLNSRFAARYTGRMPAVWSTDMGFAKDGDTDSYRARPDIVREAVRQHGLGSIVTICWHAVPPTADEPVVFRQPFGAAEPESLASVQGRLTDRQFDDVLTPGTALYAKWCRQVDSVAVYLKQLSDARVPVLWRPYHEMNGSWFWWGGRHGPKGTAALVRQLFDRYTRVHCLDNLIWIWSVDRPNRPEMNFSFYYPGGDCVDILALDVYGNDFNPAYYDSLSALAGGRPMVLGEVGNPPTPEILASQPGWGYYVVWAGMARNTPKAAYDRLFADPRILNRGDAAYAVETAAFRATCGLPRLNARLPAVPGTDFSGEWLFREAGSALDGGGAGSAPDRLDVYLDGDGLTIRRTVVQEWGDEFTTVDDLRLDGSEFRSELPGAPGRTTARRSASGDTLFIDTKTAFHSGNGASETTSRETWTLGNGDRLLSIRRVSDSFRGRRDVTLVYERRNP
jgi:mannan endo-1,4-beta-mannosidase